MDFDIAIIGFEILIDTKKEIAKDRRRIVNEEVTKILVRIFVVVSVGSR